jgi:outer membrane protein assembly factor BamB
MSIKTNGWAALLIVPAFLLAAPPSLAQSNPPCGGVSATAYVNWPQLGYDPCHTGYNPNEFLLSPGTVGNLALDWTYTTGDQVFATPTIANGIAYVGTFGNGYMYAVNATTGALVWKFATGNSISSTPAVANGVIYFGGGGYDFYALNAATGALLWKYSGSSDDHMIASPALANGIVYTESHSSSSAASTLYALNATTGTLLWQSTTEWGLLTSPAVANGIVYVGWQDYNVYSVKALNALTGALVWSYTTGGGVTSPPIVVNGVVYVTSLGFYALDASTGALLWRYSPGSAYFYSAVVANRVVYAASSFEQGTLCALDASTGALLWESPGIWGAAAFANGVLYVPDVNSLGALDAATGALLWESPMSPRFGSPVVVNGMVFAGSPDHNLYAFHLPGH